MIVLDNSVLVSLHYEEGPQGKAARERLRGMTEVYAPALIDLEFINVTRSLLRAGKVTEHMADRAMRKLPSFPIRRVKHEGLLLRVWELRHNYSPYDASYIALAEQLGATLLTGDARLQRGTGKRCAVELIG
ncbi:type II toxin-antitoxin system VapC family toxin [Streptomyces sp. NPDC088923]|uniref:type II toxin-antitoxin system VapC family toxin n=1 Tax=Streptomyces sp. NPDC088923 TaxID=3365913 RepID=UPI0037F988EA